MAIFLYVALRLTVSHKTAFWLLLFTVGLYALVLNARVIFSFLMFQAKLSIYDFPDASQFKGRFNPLGWLNNVWATLAIGFVMLPLAAAVMFRHHRIGVLISLFIFAIFNVGILITFSRGAYLSLFFFWVLSFLGLWIAGRMLFTRLLLFAGLAGGMIILLMLFNLKPVLTTLEMNKTVSRQRSTQGRLSILERSWCQLKGHEYLGVGGLSYNQR